MNTLGLDKVPTGVFGRFGVSVAFVLLVGAAITFVVLDQPDLAAKLGSAMVAVGVFGTYYRLFVNMHDPRQGAIVLDEGNASTPEVDPQKLDLYFRTRKIFLTEFLSVFLGTLFWGFSDWFSYLIATIANCGWIQCFV